MTTRAFVALGTNLGERSKHLEFAIAALDATPGVDVVRCSSFHETEPVGGPPGQGRYLNAVVELSSELDARALLSVLMEIEQRGGRVRGEKNGPRTLDLDLLVFGDEVIEHAGLVVPHPRLEERLFVLMPLAELAGELRLRKSGVTVTERVEKLIESERQRSNE